jgi:hypothetical protein
MNKDPMKGRIKSYEVEVYPPHLKIWAFSSER